MVTKTKQLDQSTKDYVAAEVDAVRQYSENLFKASSERVSAEITARLQHALTTIRPAEVPKQVTTLVMANQKHLMALSDALLKAAVEYQMKTGFKVRHVVFEEHGQRLIARVAVVNA